MFIGVYTDYDNKEYCGLYYKNGGYDLWFSESFNANEVKVLDLKVKGNNYAERKAYLEDLAIDYSNNFASLSWSYSELAEIQDFFYKNAKRYGLLEEFRENAIC